MVYRQIMSRIIDLNNEGVDLIEIGNLESAISCFTTALTTSNVLGHMTFLNQSTTAETVYKLDQLISFEALPCNPSCDDGKVRADEEQGEETAAGFIFQQPFRITAELNQEDNPIATQQPPTSQITVHNCSLLPDTQQSVQTLAAITMFNFGLAFHLSSVPNHNDDRNNDRNNSCSRQQRERRETLLQTAIRLYENAFELQNTAGLHAPSSAFYFMAILNNLSHAHLLLGNRRVSDNCSLQLLSTMMYLVDSSSAWQNAGGDGGGASVEMPSNVSFDRFFRSIYHLVLCSHGAAAA